MVDLEAPPGEVSVARTLRAIIDDFSTRPLQNGKQMRDLLTQGGDAFRRAASAILSEFPEERGCRYLVTMLWSNNILIPALSDPALPKTLTLKAGENAAKVDPQIHLRIMRYLTEAMLDGYEVEEDAANRLLEILGATANSDSLGPFLRKMFMHSSVRVRSKVTILIGRGQAGWRALERLLQDPDPRVQANAIEALWGRSDESTLTIFREALQSPNNRVVGNAVLGLYQAGQTDSIRAALDLVSREEALFRCSAAWVMSKSLDPRLVPMLGRLVGASENRVRQSAFSAVRAIKAESALRARRPAILIKILDLTELDANRRRLRATARLSDTVVTGLRGTDFMVDHGATSIVDYASEEIRHGSLILAVVMPRAASRTGACNAQVDKGLRACLELKRRTEQWSIARYQRASFDQPAAAAGKIFGQDLAETSLRRTFEAPVTAFTAEAAALKEQIGSASARNINAGLFFAAQAVIRGKVPKLGSRHMFLLAEESNPEDEAEAEALVEAAHAAQFTVHALTLTANPALARVCKATGGFYRLVQDPAQIPEQLLALYAAASCH